MNSLICRLEIEDWLDDVVIADIVVDAFER